MPSGGFGTVAKCLSRHSGESLGFLQTHHLHLAATFRAPGSDRPGSPDGKNAVGFDGNFGPFMGNHSTSPKIVPPSESGRIAWHVLDQILPRRTEAPWHFEAEGGP